MKEPKRLRHYFPLFLLLLCQGFTMLLAQGINLGIPPTRNFSKNIYQAGTQNWDAAQDSRGVLYFANNEGLLQYDGSRWSCLPVANKTVTRSVAIDSKGRIFVGAQNEMGYFFPDKNGQLRYHSLVHLIAPEKRNFEDVWDIVVSGESVFFRTQQSVFQFTGESMTMLQPGGNLTAMFLTPVGLLLQRNISEILLLENGTFRPFIQQPELNSELTAFMHWQGDTLLFASLKSGLFCLVGQQLSGWQTPHDALLKQKRIYSAAMMPNGHLVLATSLDGMIELDQHRRIYRHLTKKNGLQNNNILHAFADRAGNLWLGLDSGIDCVLLPSPFTSMVPDADLEGTGYTAAVFENQLYLGVSNGVYRTAWNDYFNPEKQPFFEKISATDGQVWS
ncbi:MAG: hypothetical protein IT269_02990, partial [Saprospiraceae bacterium]|nr:hypothetical protein [Saprospiraceae bacterium]